LIRNLKFGICRQLAQPYLLNSRLLKPHSVLSLQLASMITEQLKLASGPDEIVEQGPCQTALKRVGPFIEQDHRFLELSVSSFNLGRELTLKAIVRLNLRIETLAGYLPQAARLPQGESECPEIGARVVHISAGLLAELCIDDQREWQITLFSSELCEA